ncbi:MAG: L-histidine N(alpha)-methyltransferase [Burkholderiales bacterium]
MTAEILAYSPERTRDLSSSEDGFGRVLVAGLRSFPKRVSPKFFYDEPGARLFDQICELPEYYLTRTEFRLLERYADEIAEVIGSRADVVEFGAGSMSKIRILLRALRAPVRYLAVDISTEHMHRHAELLQRDFPALEVTPFAADFTRRIALPAPSQLPCSQVGFFPGSSIGNFTPTEACQFLSTASDILGGGGILIGVDLIKAPAILHAAYNDSRGVTAAFNKNLLARANRELGADFDLGSFEHYAFFNPGESRVEMHLVSMREQQVRVAGESFHFAAGETLHTENSYKYSVQEFHALARRAGFEPQHVWCDEQRWFSVHWLVARS